MPFKGAFDLRMPLGIDGMIQTRRASNTFRQEQGAWSKIIAEGSRATPADEAANPSFHKEFGMPLGGFGPCTRNSQPMALRKGCQAIKGQSTADEGPSLVRKRDEDADRLHGV